MEALLKNLKKYVECSICLESFTEPKTIACLHTFCCECLKKHALTSQRDGQFRCPECQTQIAIPEGNRLDQLPTSFLHNSLLSLLAFQQSGNGSQISCKVCTKKSAELSYEGREGVKWELGLALLWTGKMGFTHWDWD